VTQIDDFRTVVLGARCEQDWRPQVVSLANLPALVRGYRHTDCFASSFLFNSRLADCADNNAGPLGDYQGPCYAHFLLLDINSENMTAARDTARRLCYFLLDYWWGETEECLVPYFPGYADFHIAIATEVFGEVKPSPELLRSFSG